jgi:glycerate kinase
MEAFFGILKDGKTAVIEMAACAGLPLAEGRLDPCRATTYGVGELMLAAASEGVNRIIVGLGGSASNDGGCGAAAAAGVLFFNEQGNSFVPTGGTLRDISRIDAAGLSDSLKTVDIICMCDIDNPLFGENGAAYVFAPQKGADPVMVKKLDAGLRHLSHIMERDLGGGYADLPGGGAAGGMGAGMKGFFGARMQMGIETVLEAIGFNKLLQGADIVFTGEGKIDGQSLRGKVVIGVARAASRKNVPVVAIVGAIGDNAEAAYNEGVTAIFSINTTPMDFSQSRFLAKENLSVTIKNVLRLALALG